MRRLVIALALIAAFVAVPRAEHHTASIALPLHVTAGLISAGGIGNPTGTGRVELQVDRWSTNSERTTFMNVLAHDGEHKLLEELQKARKVGWVRFNTELAWDLRYARQVAQPEGGTRVVLATDRPMSAWEIWNEPRYSDYPFTIFTLDVNADGQPSGSVMLAARVRGDKDGRLISVENFATQPIRMTNVEIVH